MGFVSKVFSKSQSNSYSKVIIARPDNWDSSGTHNNATPHEKAKIEYLIDQLEDIPKLLEVCFTNDSPFIRSAAMSKVYKYVERDYSFSNDEIGLLKDIVDKDTNEHVYFDPIYFLLRTNEGKDIEFIKKIAITHVDSRKRFLSIFQLIHFIKYKSSLQLQHFIKERVLVDECNFVRVSIVDDILDTLVNSGDRKRNSDLTSFAIQWVKHTDTVNYMSSLHPLYHNRWFQNEKKINGYFDSEERPLLIIGKDKC